MNAGVEVALLVPVAYLLGTFPSAELVARRRGRRRHRRGLREPGASNTFRLLGWKAGALVFALDVAEGRARRRSSGSLVDGHRGAYVLGVAAILGHMLPVTRKFKGGRGVATGAGVMLVIFPLLTLGAARACGSCSCALTHKASVASITVVIAFPIAVALAGHAWRRRHRASPWWRCSSSRRHLLEPRRLVRGEELGLDPGDRPTTARRRRRARRELTGSVDRDEPRA